MMWSKDKSTIPGEPIDTLIAADVRVRGDVEFSSGIQVDGRVEGSLRGVAEKSVIRITKKGSVKGDVKSPYVVINGSVEGSVYAYEHLQLGAECHITGDVHYNVIEMLCGAEVNGQMVHEEDISAKEAHHRSAKEKSVKGGVKESAQKMSSIQSMDALPLESKK